MEPPAGYASASAGGVEVQVPSTGAEPVETVLSCSLAMVLGCRFKAADCSVKRAMSSDMGVEAMCGEPLPVSNVGWTGQCTASGASHRP